MSKVKFLICALATVMAAAGVFGFSAYAGGFAVAEPAEPTPAPAPTGPTTPMHYTAPRYFNPTPPREDNPTNPPGTWEVYPSPTGNDLYCVDFVDVNNGWAGGRSVALRYRNGTWSVIPGHSGHVFSDLDMLSQTDGWAVGWDGNKELPAIWRWNGSDWKESQNPTGGLSCIDMIDAYHGWIGGNGYFLRFNGTNWEYGGNAPNNVQGIDMKSETEGRAVGFQFIMRCAGGNWTVEVSNVNWHLADVQMLSGIYGWASGEYLRDKGLLLKYIGGNWKEHKVLQNVLMISSFDIFGDNFGWCVGRKTTSPPYGSFIAFFDGTDWAEVRSPTNNSTVRVKVMDRDNAWIVGWNGTILKYKANVSVRETSLGKIKGIYR
jgi:hypothetical protein